MSEVRVAVMGGSLGGLNAALWLRELAGCDVEVYERSDAPLSGQGAGIVLNPATVRYFTELGVLDLGEISVSAQYLRYMGQDGSVAEQREVDYLFSSYNALYRGFLNSFGDDYYHLGTPVESFDASEDSVAVSFANGDSQSFDMLVCADGIRSGARRALLPGVDPEYAGYVAWRGTVGEADLQPETYALMDDAITYHVLADGHLLTYPIPMVDRSSSGSERPYINWLWYRNIEKGHVFDSFMTDKTGTLRPVSLPPGSVREESIEQLQADATSILPPPLVETVHSTEKPFIQAIYDSEVDRMAFGRVALMGDAAFGARPHAAAGTAKAAEDGYRLALSLRGSNDNVASAITAWETNQLALGRSVLNRTREAGKRSQFEGSWRVGDPLPFGLYEVGDSEMTVRTGHPAR